MVAFKVLSPTTAPHISEAGVKVALDSLLHGSHTRLPNPLEDLLLVDEAMMDTTLPRGASIRNYMLFHILTSMITDELAKYRHAIGNVNRDPETSREQALEAIAYDVQNSNSELLGWSWLYYHYVRVDLDISSASFCGVACIDQRTLQRYRQQAILRLMFQLIAREHLARKIYRKRHLYAQLPTVTPPLIYGRDDALSQAHDLSHRSSTHHIQVLGASGIGKTVFVQKAIRSLVDSEAIDLLIWMDRPTSVREIYQRLSNFLGELRVCASLWEFLQCQRTAFVFDGADKLCCELDYLNTLLNDLSPAVVYLTSRVPLRVKNSMSYIVLSALQQSDAQHLIGVLLNKWHIQDQRAISPEDIRQIWEQSRGNPEAIVEAVLELQTQRTHECIKSPISR